ncbi:phosphoribosylformylglycinamidine synthase subunit PurQ, partial [Enterococcus faecium]|nr:phosphoribosylformylglycinamidine synthase subunit PurQ [Enterococcus faecium]
NDSLNFICKPQKLVVENNQTIFTKRFDLKQTVMFPIAHGEGNYYCDSATLQDLKDHHQIVLRYQNNPNGSTDDIAGIINQKGNVLGMMPHPERASEAVLGGEDGKMLFQSLIESMTQNV